MALRTLRHSTALISLLPHADYTVGRLNANPLVAHLAAPIEALRGEGLQLLLTERDMSAAQTWAQVRVDTADDRLNHLAGRVSKAILTITNDERDKSLYTHFFGNKNLTEFRRPKLGEQLEAMTKWIPSLQNSPFPALQAMAPELAALVEEADEAVKARDNAQQQNRFFRDVGARHQWVENLNAARKELYGVLGKLAHQHPELPSNFADLFFMKKSEGEAAEEPEEETAEALREHAEELRQELQGVEGRIQELEAAEAAARRAAEARAAEEARLAELDRKAAELERERKALRARLGTST